MRTTPTGDGTVHPRGRRVRALAAAVLTAAPVSVAAPALTAPAAGAAPAPPQPGPAAAAAPDPDAFYTAPADPGAYAPGEIIRQRPAQIRVGGVDAPVRATTVLYRSTDTHGAPIAVSGTVVVPEQPRPGADPRPLVVLAPGTQGQGDQCAPSKTMLTGESTDNLGQAAVFLAQGYAVAVTDYEGLGTPGIHTYMNRLSQAHTVLDMGRAAKALGDPAIAPGAPVGLWGYSQGGGAVASAVEQVDEYAPGLGVRGAFAGAPPADLAVTTERIDGSRLAGAMGYAVNGLEADYPQVAGVVDAALNDRGRQLLADTATQCTDGTVEELGGEHSTAFTASGEPIETLLDEEPIRSVVDAQRIGTLRPDVPVFVVTGDSDDIVPARTARTLVHEWCALGGPVTFRDYPTPPVAPMINHVLAMPLAMPEAVGWLGQRLAGVPDAGTCGG